MRQGVEGVLELTRQEDVGILLRHRARHLDRPEDAPRRDDHLAAVAPDDHQALLAHALGHHGSKADSDHRARHGERDARGPARRLDDDRVRREISPLDRVREHESRHAILGRSAGEQVLELHPDGAAARFVLDGHGGRRAGDSGQPGFHVETRHEREPAMDLFGG